MVQCAGDFDSKPVSKKGIPPWPLCQAERLKNSRASEISDPEETPADEDLIQKIDLENLRRRCDALGDCRSASEGFALPDG